MSEMLLGWPNGTVGMLLGTVAGLLVLVRAWRDKPWDVHDEYSYEEPARFSLAVAAPSLVLLGVLLSLLLGIGALDKGIDRTYAIVGDVLGLVLLPATVWYIVLRPAHRRPG